MNQDRILNYLRYIEPGEIEYWRLNQIKRVLRAAKPEHPNKALIEVTIISHMSDEQVADLIANGAQRHLDERYFQP